MRRNERLAAGLCALALGLIAGAQASAEEPEPTDEAPKGEIQRHVFDDSSIFPGTTRDYWIYIPKQYDPSKPACLFVCQDGIQYNAPAVFDELIHKGEIPVLIGVFVMHGRVPASSDQALDRFNRSYEYDGLGDAYVRFLEEELLPEVERKTAKDGRPIRISRNGDDRAIGGSSSGAICAFTAAWERPDSFRRVFSAVGTYVGLRGGNDYPTLIRKVEPKPLRVFLEDGSNDLNIYGGDWWMANQTMERALKFAGYEVEHSWGDGEHNAKHATEIFPDAMRWLWRDWPKPIQAGLGSSQLQEVLIPGEGWTVAAEGVGRISGVTANAAGEIVFGDLESDGIHKIGVDGVVAPLHERSERIVEELQGHVLRHDGRPIADANLPRGHRALSPDQSLLYVADPSSRWILSYQIRNDGKPVHGQKYYHLHMPDDASSAGAGGLQTDRDGRLYVATSMGVQVCDQAGRVNMIIPTPKGGASAIHFGGPNFDILYAVADNVVYKRKVKPQGANAFDPPIKPAPPKL